MYFDSFPWVTKSIGGTILPESSTCLTKDSFSETSIWIVYRPFGRGLLSVKCPSSLVIRDLTDFPLSSLIFTTAPFKMFPFAKTAVPLMTFAIFGVILGVS